MLWLVKINFRGFCRFLIHGNLCCYIYTMFKVAIANICSTWFLDIRISTCLQSTVVSSNGSYV